ncbi:MAG: hypothetical protein ABI959_01445 [Candidatus Dormiibacterota bacterium]
MAGTITGIIVFALFVGLGLTLLNRVASPLPVIILAVAGAYAGWLVGVIAFGAVRGGPDQRETEQPQEKKRE